MLDEKMTETGVSFFGSELGSGHRYYERLRIERSLLSLHRVRPRSDRPRQLLPGEEGAVGWFPLLGSSCFGHEDAVRGSG